MATKAAEVGLIFPPLVTSSLGSYYPSTASLAGYLHHHGINSSQLDLNNFIAQIIIESSAISLKGTSTRNSHIAAVQLLEQIKRTDPFLIKLRTTDRSLWVRLLEALLSPLLIEAGVDEILTLFNENDKRLAWYRQLFSAADLVAELGQCNLIGISIAMGPQLAPALFLARYLKELGSKFRIVVGGPVISLMPTKELERILRQTPEIDCAVKFEGEHALLELYQQCFENRWSPNLVQNACCVTQSGAFAANKPSQGPSLPNLPYAKYESTIIDRYGVTSLSVLQARGCYWGKCSYCDYIELYQGSPKYRVNKAVRLVDEIQSHIQQYGIYTYTLVTEALAPSFARQFADEVIKRQLQVKWSSFAMVHRGFDEELMRRLVASGCECLIVGLETLNTRTLNLVNKWADRETNVAFLRAAKRAGLPLRINIIPDLPTTSYREAMDTLSLLTELQDTMQYVSIFPFEATQSSAIGREPERFGLRVANNNPDMVPQSQFTSNHLPAFDAAMSNHERQQVYLLFKHFARTINVRGAMRSTTDVHIDTFDIALERFAIFVCGNQAVLVNLLLGAEYRISRSLALLIRVASTIRPLTIASLASLIPTETDAAILLQVFHTLGILRRYDDDRAAAAA